MFSFKRREGFTLIEALIVMVIIGIMAAAMLPRLTGGQDRAYDAQRKADLQQIATALEFYNSDNAGLYPTGSSCVSAITGLDDYLTTVPSDPQSKNDWGTCTNDYQYVDLNSGESYLLIATLATNTDSGTGIYESAFSEGSHTSASDVFSDSANEALLCSATDCSASGKYAIYVVGR